MASQPRTSLEYRAYLLKLWRETDEEQGWRLSLEEIGGEYDRRGFASLEALVEFLEDRILAGDAMPPGGEAWEDRAEWLPTQHMIWGKPSICGIRVHPCPNKERNRE